MRGGAAGRLGGGKGLEGALEEEGARIMASTLTVVRVRDLPEVKGRKLAGGGYVEPVRPTLFCPSCAGEWSATPGDYFWMGPDEVFRCRECEPVNGKGVPLQLVRRRTVYEPW